MGPNEPETDILGFRCSSAEADKWASHGAEVEGLIRKPSTLTILRRTTEIIRLEPDPGPEIIS
jgi:hypothetical protein